MVHIATQEEVDMLIKMSILKPSQSLYPNDLVFVDDCGCLALRPVYYAHSFFLAGHGSRVAAEALFSHADGYIEGTRRAGSVASGCLFHVHRDNDAMIRFIESKGAVTEPDSILYRYDQITQPKE